MTATLKSKWGENERGPGAGKIPVRSIGEGTITARRLTMMTKDCDDHPFTLRVHAPHGALESPLPHGSR
jgi:hypothetical protein